MSRPLAVGSARLLTASASFRILAVLMVLLISNVSMADELPNPRLLELHPKGGQNGTQVDLSLSGADLDEGTQMIFSHPGITAAPKDLYQFLDHTGRPMPILPFGEPIHELL